MSEMRSPCFRTEDRMEIRQSTPSTVVEDGVSVPFAAPRSRAFAARWLSRRYRLHELFKAERKNFV
jgi:hypothetical protein